MYFWRVLLIGGDEIQVTPDKAQKIKQALTNPGKSSHIGINGNMISISSISRVEETMDRLPQATKQIESGLATGPILNKKGEVKWHWAKKRINNREWNNYYGQHPSYRLLRMHDNGAEIAFKMPSHMSAREGVEPLTEDELRMLGGAASAVTA